MSACPIIGRLTRRGGSACRRPQVNPEASEGALGSLRGRFSFDRIGDGAAARVRRRAARGEPLRPRTVAPIECWEPRSRTPLLTIVAVAQLAASALMLVQAGWAVTCPWRDLPLMAVAAVAGWALADLVSGRVHKWVDAYGDESSPGFGGMIRQFQHHHRRPMDATRMPWIAALWGAAKFTMPLSIVAVLWPSGPAMQIFHAALLTGLAISQHAHNLAHIPTRQRPWWLAGLQKGRVFLPHKSHVKEHHHNPWDEYFEPLAGWWSELFRRTRYNRAEERAFWYLLRAVPRTWDKPELAPPSYLDEDMHWRSGIERLRYDWRRRALHAPLLGGRPRARDAARSGATTVIAARLCGPPGPRRWASARRRATELDGLG